MSQDQLEGSYVFQCQADQAYQADQASQASQASRFTNSLKYLPPSFT